MFLDQARDQLLGFAVGHTHRRVVRFRFEGDTLVPVAQRHFAGAPGDGAAQVQLPLESGHAYGAASTVLMAMPLTPPFCTAEPVTLTFLSMNGMSFVF